MKQLVGKANGLDMALMARLKPTLTNGTLTAQELEAAFTLFGQVCNHVEEIQYEMAGMHQAYQFLLGESSYAAVFANGECQVYSGQWPTPTVIFTIAIQTVLDIMTGNVHSSVAQMNGDITYTGPRHDAIAFQRIFELVLDEFV